MIDAPWVRDTAGTYSFDVVLLACAILACLFLVVCGLASVDGGADCPVRTPDDE